MNAGFSPRSTRDMKVSYRWLNELVDIGETPQQLGTRFTNVGLAVDALDNVDNDFVFELDVYCVNGHAAQANAAAAPNRGPPRRRPTIASPRIASRSKRIDVKWTACSESHLWLQPKTR